MFRVNLIFVLIFVCSLIIFFTAPASAQNKPLDWYQIASALLTKGNTPETATFEARLRFIIDSIKRRGVSFEMTGTRENLLRNSGAGDDLIMIIREAKKIDAVPAAPDSAEYFFLRGNACAETDANCKLNNYTKAIRLNPRYAGAYNNRAMAFLNDGQREMALKDFARAIELVPNFALNYVNRGGVYQDAGDHRQAIKDFNQAIEINPRFAVAYYNRGVSLAQLGNKQQAFADYNKAISLNPKYADAYLNRGAIYTENGKYDLAVKDFTKAIELNPKDDVAYNNRGIVYEKLGENGKAEADYQRAKTLRNSNE